MATAPSYSRWPSRFPRVPHAAATQAVARLKGAAAVGWEFWLKINNDWIFNLAAILAYNFLVSIIPVAILLLAIAGFLVGNIEPGGNAALQRSIAHAFPDQLGVPFVNAVAQHLRTSAPFFFVLGVATSLVTGSRLFIGMENCFGVIFRLRGRDIVHQNLMAVAMLLLYVVLVPLLFLGSIVPAAILRAVAPGGRSGFGGFLFQAAGVGVSLVVAFVLFGAIYVIVPNRRVHWGEALKGTLVASVLLVLYETLFPIYVSLLLHPNNYGSIAGLLLVVLIFLFYLAFILLLGAEVMSWAAGQRRTTSDIAGIFHEIQAHGTLLGAAGKTAGLPSEDLQHHKGASAMRDRSAARRHESQDHRHDAPPPEVTEEDE